ncbi:hypothetical protein MTO96_003306 [Rhipicephalus appendiculatus]
MFILRTSLLLIFYKSGSSMASSILDLAKEVEIYVRTCKPDGLNSLNITGGERRNNLRVLSIFLLFSVDTSRMMPQGQSGTTRLRTPSELETPQQQVKD